MRDPNAPPPDFTDVHGGSSSESMSRDEASAKTETYTVVAGDTLTKIAKHYYGDATKWKPIWEANKSQIRNPDLIQIGQVLTIPKAP